MDRQDNILLAHRIFILKCVVLSFIAMVFAVSLQSLVRAEEVSWLSDSLHVEVDTAPYETYMYKALRFRGCEPQKRQLAGTNTVEDVCLIHGLHYDIGNRMSTNDVVIGFHGDSYMHIIKNMNTSGYDQYHFIPGTDMLVYTQFPGSSGGVRLYVYKDFPSLLTRSQGTHLGGVIPQTEYTFNSSNPDFQLRNHTQTGALLVDPDAMGYSSNAKYMVADVYDQGLVRIDLNTFEQKAFSKVHAYQYDQQDRVMSVSDDGSYVITSETGASGTLYRLNNECGNSFVEALQLTQQCQSRDISQDIRAGLALPSNNRATVNAVEFDDAHTLSLRLFMSNNVKTVTINPESYNPPQLDYLALGDSYSSGEGDTEKNKTTDEKYYRSYTDNEEIQNANQPREKCHVSTRSYPYILSKGMALGSPKDEAGTKWQTVACSGAQKYDVENESNNYLGQGKGGSEGGKPRLEGYANASQLKLDALNEFIPGRNEQIEFVKKYKPKVITLTMGGNDVGFADKIRQCISLTYFGDTCDPATETGKKKLAKEILDQYDNLKSLYGELYSASGNQAKIYVLGYPGIINGGEQKSCDLNVKLDDNEREMVSVSIDFMNTVIHQAADAAGVEYIDIANSLIGGRLCDEGQEYMTGITLVGSNEVQESFHPNAKGHFEIAMTVWDEVNGESLLDYDVCPDTEANSCPLASATKDSIDVPPYFGSVADTNTQYKNMTSSKTKKISPLDVVMAPFTFLPTSLVKVVIHSDPTDLGDFTVATDGSLEQEIQIPSSVPAGYHTLTVQGQTYSGEPIEFEQVILVEGTDPTDVDENGVLDSQQLCGPFLQAAGVDVDMDGLDDACDPEIPETPQLYRLRQGDPERTYAGQPEKVHYLYIERNTRASSITGVAGDDDPDGDGWAVVGVSQGKQYTSTSVPDTAPAANFEVVGDGTQGNPYQPIVSLRAGGWGCVQYRPTSLSKVTASQVRTLTRISVNTDTCRQASSEDDVDGNGLPDNTQPLYIARNGDLTKNEDPSRIYLYRNFYASEAQLGISDYTPTGTAANTIAALPLIPNIVNSPNDPIFGRANEPIQEWNLLAASKANEYIPAFNKLVILDTSHQDNTTGRILPVILTKKQNGQCVAYRPANTNTIKFNQVNNLVKMINIPQGEDCE